MKTIFYVAGKSGGHIIPALTLAQQQTAQEPTTIGIFSTDAALDAQLIASCPAISHHISLSLNNISLKNPRTWYKIFRACITSVRTLWRYKPEKLISTGGLVSVPVCAAAWMLRIPFEVYEFNVEPGAAVKFLAPRAHKVHVCFDATRHYLRGTIVSSPYPVRYGPSQCISPQQAREQLQLPLDKKFLMIIGGSQGSRFFNTLARHYITQLTAQERRSLYIVHQTGSTDAGDMREIYKASEVSATVFDYSDAIALYYQAADYVVTRAGAGVLHELLFFQKSALIVPLEVTTTSHQVANAQAFVQQDPERWSMVRQQELQSDETLLHRLIRKKLFS